MSTHHDFDDPTLLREFRDTRGEKAFTELVRRHLPMVFHVALRRLGKATLAEEAAQNAFTCLASKVAIVARHPERLRAWLHRTTWFEASALARKETRLSRVPIEIETTSEPMKPPEIYDRLDEALNRLPELDRELVLRHCCGGQDYRQMSAAIGMEATHDPLATLTYLTRIGTRDPQASRPWQISLNRLMATGGDWQGWFARMLAEFRDDRTNSDALYLKAKLLQRLSRRE